MRSHQYHANTHPQGRVDGPGLLYGGIGLALALAVQMAGLFKQGDVRLQELLLHNVFGGVAPEILTMPVLILFAAVFSFGLAFAVLDSPGVWRRLLLGITAIIVVLAMVPTLAVWHFYFSPFLPLIALFWSWFCSMMYANHHMMPCDISVAKPAQLPLPASVEIVKDVQQEVRVDPDAKYQPKDLKQSNDEKEQKVDG